MKIIKDLNDIIDNPKTRPFLVDSYYPETDKKLPLVLFLHGYKGYKDWGCWDLMAEKFAEAGFYFVKYNSSHNGTTLSHRFEFADMKAFAENNYTKELSDLSMVLNYFYQKPEIDKDNITLIGHSRGGGISIIKTFEDERIKNLITWASVDTLDRFPRGETFEKWKKDGVFYVLNGRTNQQMPHHWQFYEDYETNKQRFDVEAAMEQIKARVLIVHGTKDEAVDIKAADNLQMWNPTSKKIIVEGTNHTFGGKEPWESSKLPDALNEIIDETIDFIKQE